jgi:hypothetical protein
MKTYDVLFHVDALPGVLAVGEIRRGQTRAVPAAAALHLVDVKGLAFANAADEQAARAELAGTAEATPDLASAEPVTAATEEH